jgi:polyphosphate kinase
MCINYRNFTHVLNLLLQVLESDTVFAWKNSILRYGSKVSITCSALSKATEGRRITMFKILLTKENKRFCSN